MSKLQIDLRDFTNSDLPGLNLNWFIHTVIRQFANELESLLIEYEGAEGPIRPSNILAAAHQLAPKVFTEPKELVPVAKFIRKVMTEQEVPHE